MCMLQSANITETGTVYLGEKAQSHFKIWLEAGQVPALGRKGAPSYHRFELTPWNWRGKSLGPGVWLDEPPRVQSRKVLDIEDVKYDAIPYLASQVNYKIKVTKFYEAPEPVMEAGQKLSDRLSMAEDKVDSLPWITIVRSGKHHIKRAEYLVTYGDSEVVVEDVKQVWAFDDSHVVMDNCMLREAVELVGMYGPAAMDVFIAEHFLVFDRARVSFPKNDGWVLTPWASPMGPHEVATALRPSARMIGV